MVPIKVSTNTSASCRCCFIQLVIWLKRSRKLNLANSLSPRSSMQRNVP
jgi:hypothetical protein